MKNQRPQENLHLHSRRKALVRLLAGWTALIVLPFFYVAAKYLTPPRKKLNSLTSLVAGKVGEFPRNTARIVRMGAKPVIVVHTEDGDFKAYSATCTHLGCTVEFRGDRGGYFHCNCHGGEYDLSGKNISGPPPRPLTPYRLSIQSDNIVISHG